MSNEFRLPNKKAVVYWPVGTGDSTKLVLRPGEIVMQIDLHALEMADDPGESVWPIVDYLVKILPKKNGRPYLSLFVLTHPDKDHIKRFSELLRHVDIGELWHTPKIFHDQSDQESLCDDAKVFRTEARRRRTVISPETTLVGAKEDMALIHQIVEKLKSTVQSDDFEKQEDNETSSGFRSRRFRTANHFR